MEGDTTVKITVCKMEVVTTRAAYEETLRGRSRRYFVVCVNSALNDVLYFLIEYLKDAMRLNDRKRKMLQGSRIRVQDVALILHKDIEREKLANENYRYKPGVLEAQVLAMFSELSPPGESAVHGIISAALRLSEPVLSCMVQLPIVIPLWFFKNLMPSLMRLSRKYPARKT